MSLFATGAPATRPRRSSRLVLGWRASGKGLDSPSGLDAYTGQVGTFEVLAATGTAGTIEGKNGLTVTAGRGLPRFETVASRGNITRLAMEDELAGLYAERLRYDFPLKVMPMSILVRAWPMYAAGTTLGAGTRWLALFGDGSTTSGGYFGIQRAGANWEAVRRRGATTITSAFAEPGGTTYPIDVLATLSAAGQLNLQTRDASLVLRNGTSSPTDANMCIQTEAWPSSIFYLSSGGRWRYEFVKVARGVRTLTDMDGLA